VVPRRFAVLGRVQRMAQCATSTTAQMAEPVEQIGHGKVSVFVDTSCCGCVAGQVNEVIRLCKCAR
jgi:hypothetical protein